MHAELVVRAAGASERPFLLTHGGRLVLGRGDSADVSVEDPEASRQHVAVELTDAGLVVTDLGSRNGTLLGDAPLVAHQPTRVDLQAVLKIGAHEVWLRLEGATGTPSEAFGLADEYEVVAELGRGAAGRVYAARHRPSGREVAIKVLIQAGEAKHRERFLREARVGVRSPYLVEILDVRQVGEQEIYLIMEWVRGPSLEQRLACGPLPIPSALAIAEQVALGLDALHGAGVVHRDVKPANILITTNGAAKLTDFGIAKQGGASRGLTLTGEGMGTLAYVSPEQAEDAKRVEPPADLYSLGATLYHFLAGQPPFAIENAALIDKLLDEEPPPLQSHRPDCPPDLAALVHRLLEKEPWDRLPSARVLADKLCELRTKYAAL